MKDLRLSPFLRPFIHFSILAHNSLFILKTYIEYIESIFNKLILIGIARSEVNTINNNNFRVYLLSFKRELIFNCIFCL